MSVSLHIYTAAKASTFPKPWSSWLTLHSSGLHSINAEKKTYDLYSKMYLDFFTSCWWHSLLWNQPFLDVLILWALHPQNVWKQSLHLNFKQEKGKLSTAWAIARTPLPTLSCIRHQTMVSVPLRRWQAGLGECNVRLFDEANVSTRYVIDEQSDRLPKVQHTSK